MSVDIAGNYLFSVEHLNFRVMKMNVFKQRDFLTTLKPCLNEFGQPDMYSAAYNDAQDRIIPLVYHEDAANSWKQLSLDYLDIYLNKHAADVNQTPMGLMNAIFLSAVNELLENFTSTAADLASANSNLPRDDDTKTSNSANLLSETLRRSPQT